jgi:histidine triad (HIT) family protein
MTAATPGCTFCAIAAGTIPAAIVLDEPDAVAFLDARPVFKGHVLVVPRPHAPTLIDLPPAALGGLFATVQRIARAVETGLLADGTFVAMNNKVSQSVPHLHVHVVPRRFKDGLRGFFWPRVRYEDDAEREEYANKIRAGI